MNIFKRSTLFLTSLLLVYVLSIGAATYVPPQGLSVIERAIGWRLVPGGRGHSLTRFREVEQYGPVDIVFAGSSHSLRGFDPRCFANAGLKTFNFGSPAQTPLNSYYLMQRYLAKVRPRLVIYEVYPRVFATDGLESLYDIATNTSLSSETVQMALATRKMPGINALIAWQWRLLTQPLDKASQQIIGNDVYISGGYVERTDRAATLSLIKPTSWQVTDTQLNYLRKTIEFVRANDAEILFVSLPITKEFREKVMNYKDATQRIRDLAMDEEVRYIDLSETLRLDSSLHFIDSDHLNSAGVQITNEALLRILEQQVESSLPVVPSPLPPNVCEH